MNTSRFTCFILYISVAFDTDAESGDSQCIIYKEYRRFPCLNVARVDLGSAGRMSECFKACDLDNNCTDIVIEMISNSDENINCYLNNGTGTLSLNSTHKVEAFGKGTSLDENLDPSGCPASFSPLPYNGTRDGCYHIPLDFATNSRTFAAAEEACQALHCRSHLIQTETIEVCNMYNV